MRPINYEDFEAGQRHGEAMLLGELIERYAGDKLEYLREDMFGKAAIAGKTDPLWAAYAEGVRQALNVIEVRGSAREAYDGIINRSFDVRTLPPLY